MAASSPQRECPSFVDRVQLYLSTSKYVDGLWVGAYLESGEKALSSVEEALGLIKAFDPRRYDRMRRDLERVCVTVLPGNLAQFKSSIRACELDERFVLREASRPGLVASAIVHEATHARLWRRGVVYQEKLRPRIERICVRQELAFAARLPNGAEVQEWAGARLSLFSSYFTDAAFRKRDSDGTVAALIYAGFPSWLAQRLVAVRSRHVAVLGFLRGGWRVKLFTLADRMWLRLSDSMLVDGLWIGALSEKSALPRVQEALGLIQTCDRQRYDRILRDLERVWVVPVPGALASFDWRLNACKLNERFVLDDATSTELIAAAIVHEATHARLWRRGIAYDEAARHRIEGVCIRRELAFAAKLPNGEQVRQSAQAATSLPPAYFSDAAMRARHSTDCAEGLRALGAPNWLIRLLAMVPAFRLRTTRSPASTGE